MIQLDLLEASEARVNNKEGGNSLYFIMEVIMLFCDDEDNYCVILGREIEGGCEVEVCEGLDSCPYISNIKMPFTQNNRTENK